MDIHIPDWHEIAELFTRFPVLLVMLLGQIFGTAFTQLVKKTYIAFSPHRVSLPRYRVSVRWLSALATYLFSVLLWDGMLGHSGAEEIVCIGAAFASPLAYDGVRAVVAWKWPDFAVKWGDPDETS